MAKLLLLDDDPDTLTWMSALLEGLGHEVRTVLSGKRALTVLEKWTPDLIISDLLMPEMDGLTFARWVRRYRHVPVMFVSIARRQAEAVLAGAVGYVQKPATVQELREAVDRVLGRGARQNTILVVDDDIDIRVLYRSMLEPRFNVVDAEHGREALTVMRSQRVDLAIVDVHMPIMNGVELIRAMRADSALEGIPVIVETTDRDALNAPVWRDLHVSQRVDKMDFVAWLDRHVEAHTRAIDGRE
ncbi:MAG TPA: response regulator [Labilithrix sp.]|nr:response regulator [Labilithrix sp.]